MALRAEPDDRHLGKQIGRQGLVAKLLKASV
jgi:hypothetical protein